MNVVVTTVTCMYLYMGNKWLTYLLEYKLDYPVKTTDTPVVIDIQGA